MNEAYYSESTIKSALKMWFGESEASEVAGMIFAIGEGEVPPITFCKDCENFRPFPGGANGECRRHSGSSASVVKTSDYCSCAEQKAPYSPQPMYDDHEVSGLLDD